MSYDSMFDPPSDSDEEHMLKNYMEDVREEALQKLTLLEIAALFRDFREFQVRWREERDSKWESLE